MRKTVQLLSAALLLGAAAFASAADAPAPKPAAGKDVDLVICLDISGSMEGLVDSARARLWDIVNQLAKAQPTPNLRVGLYSYGNPQYDIKAGWVRKELDLTNDLDALYQKLFSLKINGGDEYVARVSVAAIDQQKWSQQKDALKIIFVAGNEPATQDPLITIKQAADKAKAHGIIINPIFCGNPDDPDAKSWRDLAALAGGRYAHIDHNKGAVVIHAPMDKDLAELGQKLNETYVAYGVAGESSKANQAAQTVNAYSAGTSVQAQRAVSQSGKLYRCDTWDLVDKCKNDKTFDLKKLEAKDLPESLKKLTPEQRETYVKDMTAKREKLQKQIEELNTKRNAYVQEQIRKNPNQAARAFDTAIRETLRMQGAPRGIILPKE